MSWTTPRTWVAGENPRTSLFNPHIRDNLREVGQDAGVAAAWTTYTPTWTNLTIGNGEQYAGYRRVGRSIFYRGFVYFGTTTTISGTFYPSLPFAAAHKDVLPGHVIAAATRYLIAVTSTDACIVHSESGNNGKCNATTPATFTTGNEIVWHGFYEATT